MPTPSCPRCGYDLSGPVATWDEAGVCPLEGTCSECGLGFRWFDVFNRDTWRLDGFVEHARGLWRFVKWAWRTTWWTVWPWNFWGRVEMHHKVRPWMWLWWFLLMVWLPRMLTNFVPALMAALQSAFGYPVMVSGVPPFEATAFVYSFFGFEYSPYSSYYDSLYGVEILPGLYLTKSNAFALAACVLWPLSMLALPISMRLARVRPVLVVRAAAFSLGPIAMLGFVELGMVVVEFIAWKFLPGGFRYYPPGIPRPLANAVLELLVQIREFLHSSGWIMLPWLAFWWLAALTRGFKLKQGVLAWLAILMLVHVALVVVLGVEVYAFGHYYRL